MGELRHKLLSGSDKCEAILLLFVVMVTMSELVGVAFRSSLLEFVSRESVHDLVYGVSPEPVGHECSYSFLYFTIHYILRADLG